MRRFAAGVAALAITVALAACSSESDPTPEPTAPVTETGTPRLSEADVTIRSVLPAYDFEDVSNTLRTSAGWADFTNQDITVLLNGTCDALDVNPEPQSAIDYLGTHGIVAMDMFLGVSAATTILCPEHGEAVA